jgi:hypothetical protein
MALLPQAHQAKEESHPAQILYEMGATELGPTVHVSELDIRIGHFRLAVEEGGAAPVTVAGRTVGLFFAGNASFRYESVDRDEWPVMATSVDSATNYELEKVDKGRALEGEVERFLLWASADVLPELRGKEAEEPTKELERHRKDFDRAWGGSGLHFPVSHFLVKQLLDHPNRSYARAELAGPRDELIYEYDPFEARSERLAALRKVPFTRIHGAVYPVMLSDQPIGRDRRAFRHPNYILSHVDYELTATDDGHASLAVTETIRPQRESQSVFLFNLDSYFFDENEARPFRVESVRDGKGRELAFHHYRDRLAVVLPEAAAAGAILTLRFDIAGKILVRPNNDDFWMLRPGYWFPQPGLAGQYYTVHSVVRVEKPFVAIAPGDTVERSEDEKWNVVENRIDKPVRFIYVVGGKYFFEEETKDGLTIRVATYAMKNDRGMKVHLNLARKLIKYYESWLGPFPFDEYNIVEINSLGWGQAPPATMFITREAFQPWFAQIWSQGVNHRIAHEVAHQYWGHVVKWGSEEEQWISEAFAEYCASFAVRQLRGKHDYRELKEVWRLKAEDSHDKSSIPLANRLISQEGRAYLDRRNLLYFKGAMVLEALHAQIGNKAFLSFVRNYQKALQWRFGTTQGMIALLKKITGDDFTPFFERCYWGTELPHDKHRVKPSGRD